MKLHATISVLLATAALAPFALADSHALTKREVIAKGSVICRAAERKVNALPSPRSQDPFAANAPKGDRARGLRFVAGYADALASVRVGLARLDAPPAGRPLLESFIAQLGPTIEAFRMAHTEAVAGGTNGRPPDVHRNSASSRRQARKRRPTGSPRASASPAVASARGQSPVDPSRSRERSAGDE